MLVPAEQHVADRAHRSSFPPAASGSTLRLRGLLTGGGIDGNEELTAVNGVLLLVLLAALGITILQIGQLIWLHLFLGLVLVGPVGLKIGSTAYRFGRYYTRNAVYLAKGPPMIVLRAIGPFVVALTVVVFASGFVLLFDGPRSRGTPLLIHKASFIVWLVVTGVHVLGHLPSLGSAMRAVKLAGERSGAPPPPAVSGAAGRWIALCGAIVGGVVLALALLPHYGIWTAPGAFPHHHHD